MEFRPATADDAPAISALIHANLAHLTIDPAGAGAERFLAFVSPQAIRGYIESPTFRYRVAICENALAGAVAIRNGSHLYHLFVLPGRQRQGLGRQLWQHARQALFDPAATTLTVNSSANAVPVYESFGFQVSGARVEHHGVAFVPMRLVMYP